MTRFATMATGPALFIGVVLALGCGKKTETSPAPVGPPPQNSNQGPPGGSPKEVLEKLPGGEEFAAGKKVYANMNCARCHKLGDTGGMPGGPPMPPGPPGGMGGPPPMPPMPPGGPPGAGPDLTNVGADATHTKQWLAEHVRDAKKHKPESRMPPFTAEQISDADLDALATYLASRKKEEPKKDDKKEEPKKGGM